MDDKANKEDDKEMVGVPKYFKIWPPDGFGGWGDDEDEGQRDDNPSDASQVCESHIETPNGILWNNCTPCSKEGVAPKQSQLNHPSQNPLLCHKSLSHLMPKSQFIFVALHIYLY